MIDAFALLVAAAAAFGLAAPTVARLGSARVTVWALSVGGVALLAAVWVGLGVVLSMGLGQIAPLAHVGDWSAGGIASHSPVARPEAYGAGAVLVALALLGCSRLRRDVGGLRLAWSTASSTDRDLVVLDDPEALAYAVPGRPGHDCGRIVVSRGLLATLSPQGRRALLAHERAHLTEHHELPVLLAGFAASGLPLLHALPRAVRTACERSADEAAVRAVGDRVVVADTIVQVARPVGSGVALGDAVFGGAGADVPARVAALLRPRGGRALVVLAVITLAASYACLVWLGHTLDTVLDASHLVR